MDNNDKTLAKGFKNTVSTRINSFFASDVWHNSLLPSLIAIIGGLLIGFIILFIVSPFDSFGAWITLILGSFESWSSIGMALYKAAVIILTGLSVAFAFKTGLFNIGASGQYVIGGVVTILVGQIEGIPAPFHWMICLLAGILAGAFWGFIPGVLKAFLNVNEVVATIMLNYIGMWLASLLIAKRAVTDVYKRARVLETAILPSGGLRTIFPKTHTIDISIYIAIIAAIIIYVILSKTTLGFQLKAVGYNRDASRYAGINEKRNIIISMSIAGALSGLAGACFYLSGTEMSTSARIPGEGFTGITVALLANSNPIGILFSGYFISHLTIGGSNIIMFGYNGEVSSIVMACIVYFMAISIVMKKYIENKIAHTKEKRKLSKQEEV